MNNCHTWLGCLYAALLLHACQSDPIPAAVDFRIEKYTYVRCVRDSICAEVDVAYPVISSSDAALGKRLTDSLQALLWATLDMGEWPAGEEPTGTLPERLEKIGIRLSEYLESEYAADTSLKDMRYTAMAETQLELNAPKYLSVAFSSYVFAGGAHGLGQLELYTLHKATGRVVELTELIADTASVRPILERAFLDANRTKEGLFEGEFSLKDLLLEPDIPLPFPLNFCVTDKGIRMAYNPYEVTPYVVGITEFVLTWDQLGAAADRNKWLR